jgi:hypothetical protein
LTSKRTTAQSAHRSPEAESLTGPKGISTNRSRKIEQLEGAAVTPHRLRGNLLCSSVVQARGVQSRRSEAGSVVGGKVALSVLNPIIRVRTSAGVSRAGLPEILELCRRGLLLDLPGMRADQRAPVVTTLAVILHLEDRYESKVEDVVCLDLVGDAAVPGFLQPALTGPTKSLPMTDLDHTTTGVAHAYKQVDALDPEQAFFALVASTWRPHIGQGRVGGARQRLLTVLLGDGVTLASEVAQLAAAYSTDAPRHSKGKSFADHLLWTRPPRFLKSGAPPFPHNELPWPYLDCRPVRLVAHGDIVGAVGLEGNNSAIQRLVEAGTGDIGDPHVPIVRNKATPMRLFGRMTYRQAHAALCGSDKIALAEIVDYADAGRHVRIGAVAKGPGKTIGYWETTVAVDRQRWALFGVSVGDRLADLSKRALAQCSVAEKALWSAARALFPLAGRHDPVADAYCRRAGDMLTDALKESLQLVAELMAEAPDVAREAQAINGLCARHLRETWLTFIRLWPDPLNAARASDWLNERMKKAFQENIIVNGSSALSARVHEVIADMDAHLTPDNRKSIRGSGGHLPMAGYIVLARAPYEWTRDGSRALRAMTEAVFALSQIRHRGPSIGRALAETEYPEARINSLLAATGPQLAELVAEVVRWLLAKDVEAVVLTDLITLAVADSTADGDERDRARHRIALDFARATLRQSRRAA